jgi:hypothetical protein
VRKIRYGTNQPTGGAAIGEGGEDGVLDEEEGRHVVLLEHDLAQLLTFILKPEKES